ncbi:WSC domain-containing protein 1 [Holothuria leucospilota]|uniref:WSC domain-containing protein 1 n=1 Tax=Holothuria leucospilota TaxID=206669 RepID=A0A9Q1CEC3_HOLLE|nr:WSC domain-containing protein 1 [Holothuria leucospilota]
MFDDKFRSFFKFFWLLPLIAAPGLILLGYYEAHQEHLVSFQGNTYSHPRGIHLTGKKLSISANQQVCLTKKFAAPGSLRVVALASAPGSGNTWTRHLLESASGIYTGSIYKDKKLYRAGFYGEYEDYVAGTVLVVKCHRFKAENSEKFETAIVLVRNPYKAMISEYNRILTGKNHTAVANPSDFSGEEWTFFVRQMGDKWFGIIDKWLAKDPNIHVVFYENLLKDKRTELEKMLEFLNIDIDPARLDCTIANQEGSFHRKSTNEFDPFTDELKTYLDEKIRRAQDLLTAFRKPLLPEEYFAKDFR